VGEVWSDDNATGSPVLGVEVVSGSPGPRIVLIGELDTDNASQVADCVTRLLADGTPDITVDLRQLTFCDSRGLTTLLRSAQRCRNAGGAMTIDGATGNVARVFAIAGADLIFATRGHQSAV
jgi:anti-anti-sigma factor